jgi:ubiquinone/menaquinone biosynthesis C-methylase UbiE
MTQDTTDHWQAVYRSKQPQEVSWFAPRLNVSLGLLRHAGLNPESRIIDIGAGASTLVDDLLDLGLRHITVLDISEASLAVARQRLGTRAAHVAWRVADAARMDLPARSYDLWHDRAALHFLVDEADAAAYVASATRAVVDGGFAVIGGFAADGPERCSGLPVARRDAQDIARLFGPQFALVDAQREQHATPWGAAQSFAYALLRKGGALSAP